MKPADLAIVLVVMVIWGLNFVVAKWGLAQFPPIFMMALRFAVETASALAFPLFTCGSMTDNGANMKSTWPPTRSTTAGAEPL